MGSLLQLIGVGVIMVIANGIIAPGTSAVVTNINITNITRGYTYW